MIKMMRTKVRMKLAKKKILKKIKERSKVKAIEMPKEGQDPREVLPYKPKMPQMSKKERITKIYLKLLNRMS